MSALIKRILERSVLTLLLIPIAGCKNEAPRPSDDVCVLAIYPGGEFTDHTVSTLRALISPPPSRVEAKRLAYDAFVADAKLWGHPRPQESGKKHLSAYGRLWESGPDDSVDRLRRAQQVHLSLRDAGVHHQITRGPCHPSQKPLDQTSEYLLN